MPLGLQQPGLAIVEVNPQRMIPLSPHVPRPNHFGAVDVGVVIDPFFQRRVIRRVADHHQVPARLALQTLFQALPPLRKRIRIGQRFE